MSALLSYRVVWHARRSIECRGSSQDTCVTFVKPSPKMDCASYCQSQGLVCTAGYDDKKDSSVNFSTRHLQQEIGPHFCFFVGCSCAHPRCEPSNPKYARDLRGSGLGCDREMFSMICECSLHDNGTQIPRESRIQPRQDRRVASSSSSSTVLSDSGRELWIAAPSASLTPPVSKKTRSKGSPPTTGVPTLCDEVHGWLFECGTSNESICYAMFGLPRKSCNEWCEESGHVCIAGIDDNPKVCGTCSIGCFMIMCGEFACV